MKILVYVVLFIYWLDKYSLNNKSNWFEYYRDKKVYSDWVCNVMKGI
jgi:hypothetical protein